QGLAHDCFGHSSRTSQIPCVALVDVGRVEEIDAPIDRRMNKANGIGLGNRRSERHGSEADRRHEESAAAEGAVLHQQCSVLAVGPLLPLPFGPEAFLDFMAVAHPSGCTYRTSLATGNPFLRPERI